LIILDGAMGTELTRRGVDTTLPLWSCSALDSAPQIVQQIHEDYIRAGAQVITTNTFRTNVRALAKANIEHRARELTFKAVDLAREAVTRMASVRSARIAGSIAPVEDCYTPELVPSEEELLREHAILAQYLAEAGVDLILVETMNTIREAVAAARAANEMGLPLWISFTLGSDNRLLSGESVEDATKAIFQFKPEAILINCIPVAQVASALQTIILHAQSCMFGAYGNVGHVDDTFGWTVTNAVDPKAYANAAQIWQDIGANIIGGCCGTTPSHISALTSSLDTKSED
jgi:S-methylmethionine-dependent homocysteine/selenocysteine methylase